MSKIEESKSNWECVTELLETADPITLGKYASYWFYKTPRRMLHSLSYYKFAAKMIGAKKRVLDVGCNEGLGTYLLAVECGFCKGVDFDHSAIERAICNFKSSSLDFACEDFLESAQGQWDAVVNFDVIEHILPENAPHFVEKIAASVTPHGMAVVGTPSLISQEFASAVSKKGHVNIYSHERLEEEMRRVFEYVFFFAAHDEVIHTGFLPLAHYYIVVGCKPKRGLK